MKLERVNKTAATVVSMNHPFREILYSYSTPVAAVVSGKGWFRTEQFFSKTTTGHINRFLDGVGSVKRVSQTDLVAMIET